MTIRVLETALPSRLGRSFRWLVGSSWVSNIGDGIIVAAGPLLVASETRDPFLVASAWMLEFLPMLLFGLFAGVVADRVDRRRLIVVADRCRVVVLAGLVATIATGEVNIALVLAAIFLLGVGETFADTSTATLLPMLVAKRDLGIANARIIAGIGHAQPARRAADRGAAVRAGPRAARSSPRPCVSRSASCWCCGSGCPEHVAARTGPRSIRKDILEGLRLGAGTTPPCARWC